jgi:hypothetical protein
MFRNRLAREVTVVVAVKTAVIIAAALFIYGASTRSPVGTAAVEQRLMAMPAVATSGGEIP